MSKLGSSGASSPKDGAGGLFDDIDPEDRVALEFSSISAYVSAPQFGPDAQRPSLNPFRQVPDGELKCILRDVGGRADPGSLVALMGPSGSGKSTLLEILGGRSSRSLRCKGQVLFNGEGLTKAVKRKLGYVAQDDLMHGCLTVFETLYYVALLRLPKSWSKEEKVARVDRVIDVLRLQKARDTVIGGQTQRGVSGGERKRTSVGSELLINPKLLLLDEPTSGLDSTIAMQLIAILRELASGGRSIVTSIHQPSSRLLFMFDTLLCLSGGRTIYYGRAASAHAYFAALGFEVEIGISMSDYLLDLASSQISSATQSAGEVTQGLIEISKSYTSMMDPEQDGFDAGDVEMLVQAASNGGQRDEKAASVRMRTVSSSRSMFRRFSSIRGRGSDRHDDRIGWWQQVVILTRRSIVTRRHDVVSIQDIAQFTLIGLLAGCFWWQIGETNTMVAAGEIAGLIYFLQMFLSFRVMFTSLLIFPSEMKHLVKERKGGLYQLSAFVVARAASDVPSDLALPTLLLVITYWMAALNASASAFFATWGVMMLMILVSQSIGLLIGALVTSVKSAQALAASLMLTFILVGGYFVSSIPSWISWIKWLSFLWYSFPLLLHIQFEGDGDTFACYETVDGRSCQATEVARPESSDLCEPVDLWAELRVSTVSPVVNGLVLLGMLAAARVAVFLALLYKTSR